jgi:hypothetical protein
MDLGVSVCDRPLAVGNKTRLAQTCASSVQQIWRAFFAPHSVFPVHLGVCAQVALQYWLKVSGLERRPDTLPLHVDTHGTTKPVAKYNGKYLDVFHANVDSSIHYRSPINVPGIIVQDLPNMPR